MSPPPLSLQLLPPFHHLHPISDEDITTPYRDRILFSDEDFTTPYRSNSKNFGFDRRTLEWVNRMLVNEKANSITRHYKKQDYKLNIDLLAFTIHSHMEEFLN